MSGFRTRIAPTPSGYLHAGNAISFLLTWCVCRLNKGHLLLRIDDLDTGRFRKEYLEDIFYTLEWLGLDYEEGPAGPADFYRTFSQVHRLDLYRDTLGRLADSGRVYACNCSRREIRQLAGDGVYRGACREKGLDLAPPGAAWRVSVPEEHKIAVNDWKLGPIHLDLAGKMGDFVVRKKDGNPAYQLASLVDDLYWNINFIVRGEDLLASTAAQLYLAEILNQQSFILNSFWHHPLVRGAQGEKLSKSQGASALIEWRNKGLGPDQLYEVAADWLGLPQKERKISAPWELVEWLREQGREIIK